MSAPLKSSTRPSLSENGSKWIRWGGDNPEHQAHLLTQLVVVEPNDYAVQVLVLSKHSFECTKSRTNGRPFLG